MFNKGDSRTLIDHDAMKAIGYNGDPKDIKLTLNGKPFNRKFIEMFDLANGLIVVAKTNDLGEIYTLKGTLWIDSEIIYGDVKLFLPNKDGISSECIILKTEDSYIRLWKDD